MSGGDARTGLLVVMGSGETAPTMVKPHRSIFDRLGDRPAVLLDTPYGFQENADDISARAVGYFAASVGRAVEVVGWRTNPPAGLPRERALARLREAGWIFAGPGSPTYALRQWHDTPIPEILAGTLTRDGIVVFASAAALTLGSHTVPVYEIYKAGVDPHWVPGMDLLSRAAGLPAVVIPHYDNAEGGHHDTRYCYLGERRLSTLEHELPDGAFVLGVDEHTAVLFDLAGRTACVVGNGRLTVRRHGRSTVYPTGSVVDFASLATGVPARPADAAAPGAASTVDPARLGAAVEPAAAEGAGTTRAGAERAGARRAGTERAGAQRAGTERAGTERAAGQPPGAGLAGDAPPSLRAATDLAVAHFDAALAARDVDGCVTAIFELDRARDDWAADTLTSDEGDHARAALRRMLIRLGELAAAGVADPRDAVSPYVEALLELRSRARERGDFPASDWIRERLRDAGVQVRDTPAGVEWDLR